MAGTFRARSRRVDGSPGRGSAQRFRRSRRTICGHTCASLSISAGVNVLALQRMLGHTSAKVTLDTYAGLFDNDLDAVAVTLDSRDSRENVATGVRGSALANTKSTADLRLQAYSNGGGGGI